MLSRANESRPCAAISRVEERDFVVMNTAQVAQQYDTETDSQPDNVCYARSIDVFAPSMDRAALLDDRSFASISND